MAYKNFKVETDSDGIALVTWDIPGRSMNVLDETSTNELDAIVKATTADATVKGVVITSSVKTFIERSGMFQVTSAMPSASVSTVKFV